MSHSQGPLNPQLTMAINQSTQCVHQARVCAGAPLVQGGCAGQPHGGGAASPGEAQQGVPRLRGPSDPNDLMQQTQKGTLAELKVFAQKHQINHAANISHGDLRLHLRRWLYRSGTPETAVSFGRHQGKTFQEVLQEDKQYLEWGLKEASSNASAGWQLVQLVTWAVLDGHLDSPFDSDMKGRVTKTKLSHGAELESILAIRPVQDPRERPQPGRVRQEEAGQWPELSGQQQRRGDDNGGCGRVVENHEGHADRDPCAQGGAGVHPRAEAREDASAGVKFSPFRGLERPQCAREQSQLGSRCSLTPSECRLLDGCSKDFVCNQYKALRDPEHLFLMELACSKESVLTKEVQNQGLRAERCSVWNGFDLSTVAGLRKSLQLVQSERPEHLWIATECTAYSPMQNLNQRDEQQKARLHQKRREQRVQHVGALIVAQFAHALGVTVHWEWARRCRAWKWGLFREFQEVCGTHTSVISCCQVNVRDHSGQALLGKEWRIESTSASFAHAAQLPCPGEHCRKHHAHAEGSDVSKTAFYSPEFAKRVVHHMLRDGAHDLNTTTKQSNNVASQSFMGLTGVVVSVPGSGKTHRSCPGCLGMSLETSGVMVAVRKDPKEPFSACEKAKVLRQLHHLHKATGHGSYEHCTKALRPERRTPVFLNLLRTSSVAPAKNVGDPFPVGWLTWK